MKSIDATNPQPPSYCLTMEDFKRTPAIVADYKPGDKVTRENFLSVLMMSFAVSRGEPKCQKAFLVWLEKKYGFSFNKTSTNFLLSGGWEALSSDEKKIFKETFKKVKSSTTHNNQAIDSIGEPFKAEIERLVNGSVVPAFEVDNIQTIGQFSQKVAEFLG